MTEHIMLGVDPGTQTGVATFIDGSLHQIQTMTHHELLALLATGTTSNGKIMAVVFEDANLQAPVFARAGTNARMMLKIAQNVGEVKFMCKEVARVCAEQGIPALGISPLKKGAKLNATAFKAHTGYQPRTNQHERDAAMVAWGYRNKSKLLQEIV